MKKFLTVLVISLSSVAVASHHGMRQADAHEHGSHSLEIATEKNELLMVYKGPIADFHDVEDLIENPSESSAKKLLGKLVKVNAEAKCEPEHAHISVKSIEGYHEGHKEHHDHDDHSKEHHKHEKHHGHDKHHDDDHHATEGGHKDVILEAHLECQEIKALKQISVNAFETLDELQSLDVDLVTDQGAQEFLLNRNNTVITF
jgi:hypothetical protein